MPLNVGLSTSRNKPDEPLKTQRDRKLTDQSKVFEFNAW